MPTTWHYIFRPRAPQIQILCGFLSGIAAGSVENGSKCGVQQKYRPESLRQISEFAKYYQNSEAPLVHQSCLGVAVGFLSAGLSLRVTGFFGCMRAFTASPKRSRSNCGTPPIDGSSCSFRVPIVWLSSYRLLTAHVKNVLLLVVAGHRPSKKLCAAISTRREKVSAWFQAEGC